MIKLNNLLKKEKKDRTMAGNKLIYKQDGFSDIDIIIWDWRGPHDFVCTHV